MDGDNPVATKLKRSLLAMVFVALLTIGVLATQVSAPESCSPASMDGSGSGADLLCCLATSSWDDAVDSAHSCGTWTIIEAVVMLLSVCVHIEGMQGKGFRGDGLYAGIGGLIDPLVKLGSGACAIVATCGVAARALSYLVNLWSSTDELSNYVDCGGNEDLGQIEHVSVALTVVHSMVLLIAASPFLWYILWVINERYQYQLGPQTTRF